MAVFVLLTTLFSSTSCAFLFSEHDSDGFSDFEKENGLGTGQDHWGQGFWDKEPEKESDSTPSLPVTPSKPQTTTPQTKPVETKPTETKPTTPTHTTVPSSSAKDYTSDYMNWLSAIFNNFMF